MDPILGAALRSWDWRIEIIVILAAAGIIFSVGWLRLRNRTRGSNAGNRWRAGATWRPFVYVLGLLILALALMSPIDVLGTQLFTIHMVQHVLLVMIIPPLLLLANPIVFILWGLPTSSRKAVGGWLGPNARPRKIIKAITGVGIVWLAYVIVIWGWHDPLAYSLALRSNIAHDLEHISFFVVAMIFWWHIIGAGPKIHSSLSYGGRFAYAISAIPPIMIAGIVIAFAKEPIYSHYELVPRLWNISVMEDQRIAGVIMWVPGSMMYIVAALIVVGRWLQKEESKPSLPESNWAADEALLAPGIKK